MTKNLGQINITFEYLEQLLGLPEEVEITRVSMDDERNILKIICQSEEPVKNITFPTKESQSIMCGSLKAVTKRPRVKLTKWR